MRSALLAMLVLGVILLAGCGLGENKTVNVFAVRDDQTLSCRKAKEMVAQLEGRSGLYQIAQSKLSYCEITGGGGMFLPVGYFDNAKKIYVFKRLELGDPQAVRRFCLDLALEAGLDSIPPADLRFATEWGKFDCAYLGAELNQLGVSVLVAPTAIPVFIDVDPVLFLSNAVNPHREGAPKRYYDEVRDMLTKSINDFDSQR